MGHHLPILCAARIACARSIDSLRKDLRQVRPTVPTAVPGFHERFHEAILDEVGACGWKRWLTLRTAEIGWRLA